MDISKYVPSNSKERMVLREVEYLGHKYFWCEVDGMYYREDTEEIALTLDFVESRFQ